MTHARVSVVVLTMGDRPAELAAALASVRAQNGVDVEIVLVVNGGNADGGIADVVIEPGTNLGIPGGRNRGVESASAPLVMFMDDDGVLVGQDVLARAAARFDEDRDLAVVALRVVDEQGRTARRHHPGLRPVPERSRYVTSFPGGASVVRKSVFEAVGGLCGAFEYGLEETDLAWRILDQGGRIVYSADLEMRHPRVDPGRHRDFAWRTARNRVWTAHRNLPLPLGVVYVFNWFVVSALRNWRRLPMTGAAWRGTVVGLRQPVGPRRPVAWRTVWRMVRLGRPPVI